MSEIREDRKADYWFRATAKQEDFAAAAAQLVRDIDYSNFRNEVGAKQGYDRAHYYGEVWLVMSRFQHAVADNKPDQRCASNAGYRATNDNLRWRIKSKCKRQTPVRS